MEERSSDQLETQDMDIWQRLGIEPTTDKKIIKKAYAKQVKNCHQETEPERWMSLHDAYERAIQYAEHQNAPHIVTGYDIPQAKTETTLRRQQEGKHKSDEPEQKDAEMEELFRNLSVKKEEKQRVLLEEIRRQICEISREKQEEQAERWEIFLESWQSQQLYFEAAYWNEIYKVLKSGILPLKAYRVTDRKLEQTEMVIAMQRMPELKSKIRDCREICGNRLMRPVTNQRKHSTPAAAWIVLGIIAFFLLGSWAVRYDGKQAARKLQAQAAESLSAYLNEKYATDIYAAADFTLYEFDSQILVDGRYQDVIAGYVATLEQHPDFLAYALVKREGEKQTIVCFDNVQSDAVAEQLNQRLEKILGVEQGMGYMYKSSDNESYETYSTIYAISGDTAVYHEPFDGDLEDFCENERQLRGEIFSVYEGSYFKAYQTNGSYIFYYPDARAADIRARLQRTGTVEGEAIATQIAKLEQATDVQIAAVGVPVSYYEILEENKQESEAGSWAAIVGKSNRETPLNAAVVTTWYMELTDSAFEQSKKEGGWQDLWIHTPSSAQADEGIYFLENKGKNVTAGKDAAELFWVEQNAAEHELTITVNGGEDENYIIAVDKKLLGISDQFEIVRENGKNTVYYMESQETKIPARGEYYMIYQIEDLLIFDCHTGFSDEDGHTRTIRISWE